MCDEGLLEFDVLEICYSGVDESDEIVHIGWLFAICGYSKEKNRCVFRGELWLISCTKISLVNEVGFEDIRCAIRRSNILQVYPRKALLSMNLGLEISSVSSLLRNEFDACCCAGSVWVSECS
jgi:hypothetical protein